MKKKTKIKNVEIKKLSEKQQKELEQKMVTIAELCLKASGKYKMVVIIQDNKGRGISRSTDNFTPLEFMQWVNAIIRFNSTNL